MRIKTTIIVDSWDMYIDKCPLLKGRKEKRGKKDVTL
jgi:hypothetical protein